jgi:hypothetical protein
MTIIPEATVLQIFGGPTTVLAGSTSDVDAGHLMVQDYQGIVTDPHLFLLTVTTPPAHGFLTLSGSPTSQFTQEDINNFIVEYHNDGTLPDVFHVTATATTSTGVATPYTPTFFERDYGGGNPIASDVGAIYIGMMFVGGSDPFTQVDRSDSGHIAVPGAGVTTYAQPITITNANSVVIVTSMTINTVPGTGGSPAACTVSSLTCPGLTFTRLNGSSITRNFTSGTAQTASVTLEVWWAYTSIGFTDILTVNWSVAANYEQFLWYTGYTGAATSSTPFDTNASNNQLLIGNSSNMPVTMTAMTPDAPDHTVSVIYAAVGFNGFVEENPILAPGGYWVGGGGGGGTGLGGGFVTYLAKRGPAFGMQQFLPGDVPPVTETLTDSELLFQPQDAFTDLSVLATRQLFISLGGTPQWMGSSGAIPFSQQPAVYLTTQGPPLDFAGNNGDGGGFAPTGTLEAAAGPGCTPYIVTEASGSAADPQWRLSVSDDGGRTWSTLVKPRSMGKLGEYLTRLRWLKMGQSRERMIRLESTDPVRKNIIGVYLDVGQGMS